MSFKILKNNELRIGIVGGGPAGAMAAYLMSSIGHNVTILEKKIEVERKVCGEYLCPEGVKLLEKMGLLDDLCEGFQDLNGMVLVSPTNIIVPTHFPQINEGRYDRGLSLNRKVFDQKLLKLAVKTGANLVKDVTVTGARQENGIWIVESLNKIFEFDLLIAADGRQSKIGHSLGHIKTVDTKRAAIHCYLPRKISRGQRLGEMHILNGNRYCGLDPVSDNEVNFSIVCDSKLLKKNTPVSIINNVINESVRLHQMFDLLSEMDRPEIKVVSSLKNKNHFIAGNNLAYVGDAAGFIDPLTGEGIYNALLTSTMLHESLMHAKNLNEGLANYKKKKRQVSFQKNILNNFFQFLIRRPALVNLTAKFLKKSPERGDQFIGIIGNIHGPISGLVKMLAA